MPKERTQLFSRCSIAELARRAEVVERSVPRPAQELKGLRSDSRRVHPGEAFFALRGARADGHAHAQEALQRGAVLLCITEAHHFASLSRLAATREAAVLLVRNGRGTLARFAAQAWGDPSHALELFAVTGTNGKTSTAWHTAQLLSALGESSACIGTRGVELHAPAVNPHRVGRVAAAQGLAQRCPPTLLERSAHTTPEAAELQCFLHRLRAEGVRTVCMEASSIGIVQQRCAGLCFSAAAFTNLSRDHLDLHHTMHAYREAKFRLFFEPGLRTCVVNLASRSGRLLAQRLRSVPPPARAESDHAETSCLGAETGCLGFALESRQPRVEAQLRLGRLRRSAQGFHGLLHWRGQAWEVRLADLPRHDLSNLLAALGMLLATGRPLKALLKALPYCRSVPGRYEVLLREPYAIVVDYAHTPGALNVVLREARSWLRTRNRPHSPQRRAAGGNSSGRKARLHVLLGCGGERDRGKRPAMGRMAARWADRIVLTNDNPRSEDPQQILEEIRAGIPSQNPAHCIPDRRAAIQALLEGLGECDVAVVAGKGDEPYQELATGRHPLDDREVVREWLQAHGLGNVSD